MQLFKESLKKAFEKCAHVDIFADGSNMECVFNAYQLESVFVERYKVEAKYMIITTEKRAFLCFSTAHHSNRHA